MKLELLRKRQGAYVPPDIGIWRVRRDPYYAVRRGSKDVMAVHYFDVASGHFLHSGHAFCKYNVGQVSAKPDSRAAKLFKEPAKGDEVDYLEGIGILEAERSVFAKERATLLQVSQHTRLVIERPASGYLGEGYAPVDYYVDVFPCDVKTITPKMSEGQTTLKEYARRKRGKDARSLGRREKDLHGKDLLVPDPGLLSASPDDIQGALKQEAGTRARDRSVWRTLDAARGMNPDKRVVDLGADNRDTRKYDAAIGKIKDFEGRDLDLVLAELIRDGVNGGASQVVKRLDTPASLGVKDSPRCYPYVVVNTGFLADAQRDRFWRKVGKLLADRQLLDLQHLVVEVSSSVDLVSELSYQHTKISGDSWLFGQRFFS